MVQIMNGSGHCSRNRAERASLDAKPEYPNGTETSIPNQFSVLPTALLPNPDVTPAVITEDEEYEAYGQNGTQGSILRTPEETNNNLSDAEKDWFIVDDPWAATASFVTPQFDDEDEPQINDPLEPDSIETSTSLDVTNKQTSLSPCGFLTTSRTGDKKYSKSLVSPKRRRKKSKGSSSSGSTISKRSTKSLQSQRPRASIDTRRRSIQSTSTVTGQRMEIDATLSLDAHLEQESKQPAESIEPIPTDSAITENEAPSTSASVPYCYRCYLKFAKYSHWKKHAIYEHILAKNPYPIVEMNYIDPASLGIDVTPSTVEDQERSAFDEENAYIDETTLSSNPEVGTSCEETSNHGRLRLCIGKEKSGAYVVKEKKSLSLNSLDNSDDSCPPVLEAPSPTPTPSFHDARSPDLVMPMLKPCPALTSRHPQCQTIQPNLASGPPALEAANLEARYRRMVSIESELETVMNMEMEVDFEAALDVATERSRVAAGLLAIENEFPGGIGSSGGIVVPYSGDPTPASTTMISEEVPTTSPVVAIISEKESAPDKEITENASIAEENMPNRLLNKLLNRKVSYEYPPLLTPNKGDSSSDSSSNSKDSDHPEEHSHSLEKNDTTCDTLNKVQTIHVSIEKETDSPKDDISDQGQSNTEISGNVENKLTQDAESSIEKNKISEANDKEGAEEEEASIRIVQPQQETKGDKEDGDGESDALQCQVCHKVFMSDDELNEHFSQDHFRPCGMGILEPESPYPPPQTPQQSYFSGEDEEPSRGGTDGSHQSNAMAPPPPQQPQGQIPVTRSLTGQIASNLNNLQETRNGPPNVSLLQPNLVRRLSSDTGGGRIIYHHPSYSDHAAQDELQNMVWRNQASAQNAQQQRGPQVGGVPRGFPPMNSNSLIHPGSGHQMSGHRMSPPNMTVGGMPSRAPGPPTNQQQMIRQPQQQGALPIRFLNPSARPPPQYGMGGSQQPSQRPSVPGHHRISPPQYPTSLHNALTGAGSSPHFSQSSIRPTGNIVQSSGGVNRGQPPPPRQMPPNPYQHQQQNALRGGRMTSATQGPLGQTIGMNQQMLNEMNARRELNSQFQYRLAGQQGHLSMPRLQQIPQQRVVSGYPQQPQQQHRPSPLSQKRPAPAGQQMSMSCIEISEIRPNKEPRMEISQQQPQQQQQQRQIVRPMDNRPNNIATNSSGTINQNVAAAIGSVGNAGVNSVRLGNSITLSVCPTSSANNSPATSPAPLRDPSPGSHRQSISSTSSSGTVSPAGGHHMSSVLAVRGVTVTPASPPITAISPASSPSPSHSPALANSTGAYSASYQQIHHHQVPQQAASVIQRGPGSISPENPRDKNFSPPVITTVRGNAYTLPNNQSNNSSSSHNFAVPRPPPPIQRGMTQGQSHPLQHSPSYAVNSGADRPERPPTVDLTDDNAQAHVSYQAQQRINGIIPQQHPNQQNPALRRFVTAQTANFPQASQQSRPLTARLPSCNICELMFPSIQSLDQHKMTSHNIPRSNSQTGPGATSPSGGGGPRPQMSYPQTQSQQSHPPGTSTIRNMITSRPPLNPGQVGHNTRPPPPFPPAGSNSILRFNQPDAQIRSQSPNRPSVPNSPQNQGKYLYIPLLDLGRIDANKMRKLEEIGISCVVPLQGNNAMTSMGIPVMTLRGEGAMSQHVPWDSVLPMGPVHQPTVNDTQQGNNRQQSQ